MCLLFSFSIFVNLYSHLYSGVYAEQHVAINTSQHPVINFVNANAGVSGEQTLVCDSSQATAKLQFGQKLLLWPKE